MARIRSLKPRAGDRAFSHEWIWYDETFGDLEFGPRLLFLGMITWANGRGKVLVLPAILRGRIFPYDDGLSIDQVDDWLHVLLAAELLVMDANNDDYAYIAGWRRLATARWNGSLSPKARAEIAERDGYICQLCGDHITSKDLEIDHIEPVVYGGTDAPENLQATHSWCNRKKGGRY